MRSGPIIVLTLASITAGCTGTRNFTEITDPVPPESTELTGSTAPPPQTPTSTSEPTALPAPDVALPDGPAIIDGVANSLVLVLSREADRATLNAYRADGTEAASYSSEPGTTITQPIWSPDGRRVAWTQTIDGTNWELVTSNVDGGAHTTHELPGRPDYITYDPTASRGLLALTPSPSGFGLFIVDVQDPDAAEPFSLIDLGVPYFSDFSPSGDRVIAHVAGDMRIVDLDGERRSLEASSIGHQTPVWHPVDDQVFFAIDTDDGNQLVAYEPATEVITELATFDSFILFDIDPTGSRLAVSVIGPLAEGGLDAFRSAPRQSTFATFGTGLWVVELADGSTTQLDTRPTTAPMWDPTGTRLLVRSALAGAGRWGVYTLDGARATTDSYDVNDSLLPGYLPFWDQFARSQTLWSPDGRMFVHVGQAESERSGVWIHDAAADGPSTFLAEGDVAFWSPT